MCVPCDSPAESGRCTRPRCPVRETGSAVQRAGSGAKLPSNPASCWARGELRPIAQDTHHNPDMKTCSVREGLLSDYPIQSDGGTASIGQPEQRYAGAKSKGSLYIQPARPSRFYRRLSAGREWRDRVAAKANSSFTVALRHRNTPCILRPGIRLAIAPDYGDAQRCRRL